MLPSPKRLLSLAIAAALVAGASGIAAGGAMAQPPSSPAAERASFIVTLRPGVDADAMAKEWRGKGGAVSCVYRHALSGFAVQVGPALAERLRSDVRVERLERDAPVHATETELNATWGLDRVDQRGTALDGAYTYDRTGAGVTIYLLDTGLRASHTEFTGRVAPGYSVVDDGNGTDDCNGHGTHVAGTAAGTTFGVAKAATLVPVRVLGCDATGSMSGIIAGVEWVTEHHAAGEPAVANMSLGGPPTEALDAAVRNSILDGITYTLSAGNDNVDACGQSPARVLEALTVGASTSADARAPYSNWGTCVDLFAPGSSITSAYTTSDTASGSKSGTSMASPHVAGIAAAYLAADPTALPIAVGTMITTGATAGIISDPAGSPNRLAYSRLFPAGMPALAPNAPTAAGAKRAVEVSWTAPADGGSPIISYTVRVHRAFDGAEVRLLSVKGDTLNARVLRLTADNAYYATVSATNERGTSDWSAPSNIAIAIR